MSLEQKITAAWYGDKKWIRLLAPLSGLYRVCLERKRAKFQHSNDAGKNIQPKLTTPVLVIGNITVGGTGKTPLIMFLCRYLQEQGVSVGVISRGYGGSCKVFPHEVSIDDSASLVGDEPLLIATQTAGKVVIDPDRYSAARYLDKSEQVDIILSDDGMQHFALPREAEIVVIDGERELGNELLLPAGPLREPAKKLDSVDLCLLNGAQKIDELCSDILRNNINAVFQIVPSQWVRVLTGERLSLDQLPDAKHRIAIAGIGNPKRFFSTLESLSISADYVPLDDHQPINIEMLTELGMDKPNQQILMTMKDAIKCQKIVNDNCWALDVGIQMDKQTKQLIVTLLSGLLDRTLV